MKDFEVSLVKRACPACGSIEEDSEILLQTRSSKKTAEALREVHNKVVGMSKEPCSKCKAIMETSFLLIGVIASKTDDNRNPYRSGHLWGIPFESAKEVFVDFDISKGLAFIDVDDAMRLGLPVNAN